LLVNFFDFSSAMKNTEEVQKSQSILRRYASVKIKIFDQQASS